MSNDRRIIGALKCLQLLREAIEANCGEYHGGLVPNITSVADLLTLPQGMLEEQLALHPALQASDAEVLQLQALHAGRLQ